MKNAGPQYGSMVKVNGQMNQSKVHWAGQMGQSKVLLGQSNGLVKGLIGSIKGLDLTQHLAQLKWTWFNHLTDSI